MPRMLSRAGIAVVILLAPTLSLAAADDVTFTTDAVISVNGVTINVSGSGGSIESMIINPTNFSVTLLSGSTFEATASGREQLAVDNTDDATGSVCNDSTSKIGYVATKTMTVVVTPSTTLCASAPATPTSGGGGGGGGGSSAPATPAVPAVPASTTTPAVPATPATPATPAKFASGLSATQIQSILDVLASFNADAETIAKVKMSLEGTVTTGSVTSTAVSVFKSNLTVGSLGSEVKALQEFLNAKGYTIATSGPGSSGNETTRFGSLTRAALIKYQKAKGITPAVGYFGPLTRAAVEAGS
jgi:hypothetical protein